MTEVKYNKSHHAGGTPEARIANRLRNSGEGSKPNVHTQHGTGPQRAHHNIHHSGHYVDPSTAARESGPQEQRHHDSATTQSVGGSLVGGGGEGQ
jgi:hypothetical protein